MHFHTPLLKSCAAAVASLGALTLVTASPASAAPADCNYMGYQSGPDQLGLQFDPQEQKMFDAINDYREDNGVPALTVSDQLRRPAMWVSVDSANRGFAPSNHVDTNGMGVAERAEYCGGYTGLVGENNYYRWGDGLSYANAVEPALEWWQQSPPHNAALLNADYTTAAVGFAYIGVDAEESQYWTVIFGDH